MQVAVFTSPRTKVTSESIVSLIGEIDHYCKQIGRVKEPLHLPGALHVGERSKTKILMFKEDSERS
jgi:hypothetical protein